MTSLSTLQWLAPEMARSGLLRNEDWIPEHCARALRLFPNQGLHTAATIMAALHPRAIDIIEQAPVLVLAASNGGGLHKPTERQFLARRFGAICNKGPKLKEILAQYGLTVQHRRLRSVALAPSRCAVVKRLSTIPASTLAQIIPEQPFWQAEWLRELGAWSDHLARRVNDRWRLFEWAASALSRERPHSAQGDNAMDVADLAAAHGQPFNERWTWLQAKAAAERWHRQLAEMSNQELFFARHGIGWNEPIDYAPLPIVAEVDGLEIAAVQSGADLFAEGKAMRHCVASYTEAVVKGRARIYSVRNTDRRLATFELSPGKGGWRLEQLKGPCNAPVPAAITRAVAKFVEAFP
jgi:hypothetical protein